MDVTSLISLLNQAYDINSKFDFYRSKLQDNTHPLFNNLTQGYLAGTISFENNGTLADIRSRLDECFEQMDSDLPFISGIVKKIASVPATLVADGTDPNLQTALADANNLYSAVNSLISAANDLLAVYQQINEDRQGFHVENEGTTAFNFVVLFDVELTRDLAVIEIIKDTFVSFGYKVKDVISVISQLILSAEKPPTHDDIGTLISALDQTITIYNRATDITAILRNANSQLKDLGKGLLNREIDIQDNTVLNELKPSLQGLMDTAEGEGPTHDSILAQLKSAVTGFWTNPENSLLSSATALAQTRRDQAKAVHEDTHLMKVAYEELDGIYNQLDQLDASSDEAAFFSEFRQTIDLFALVSTYIEGTCGTFALLSGSAWDLLDSILTHPRYKVSQFSDTVPFALLPVRLETRFMTIKHVRDNIQYSRYTDVIRSDSDMVQIRATKETNKLMFTSDPISGGSLQVAPFQEIIPDDHELWVRIYPDNIAIHTHEDELTQDEVDNALTYWIEFYKARGNPNSELGAWRALCNPYGSRRAAWIISQTTPTNYVNRPDINTAPATTTNPPEPLTSLSTAQMPTLPTNLTLRATSWSDQPHSRVMPDRFVVRVYSNNTWREVVGKTVPNPLPVGIDPAGSFASYLNQYNSEINMPPELRWLTDFEEAEKIGMGIRIPLTGKEITDGFDRLLVLGLKLSITEATAKQEFEKLFDNHHYAAGLALVPQGTPTNNTEDVKTGFSALEQSFEDSFTTELGSNLFTVTSSHYDKADGQRLAEALGVDTSVFQHIANSNTFDIQESMAMTNALWPATLGFYLKNMLTPSIVQSQIDNTKSFFTDYVLGRGLIPAFRIRNQPYGVLPSTVYSKWKYSDQFSYEGKLYDGVLNKMRLYWKQTFFPGVQRISNIVTNPDNALINIMGLQASSVQFHQRVSVGSIVRSNITSFLTSLNGQAPSPALTPASASQTLDNLFSGPSMESFSYLSPPRIFEMAFSDTQRLLNGPVIDTLPLSEKRTVENHTLCYANYIQWLAMSPMSNIRDEDFTNIQVPPLSSVFPPKALLYLLLRHAWILEILDTAHCVLTTAGVISVDAWHNHELLKMTGDNSPRGATAEQKDMLYKMVKSEVLYETELGIEDVMRDLSSNQQYLESGMTPDEFHQFLRDQSAPAVEDATGIRYEQRFNAYTVDQAQWSYLRGTFDAVSPAQTVEDFILSQINSGGACYPNLKAAHDALLKLSTLPTARLERCLAEHLDTCAYRLDSWMNGLVSKRLFEQRAASSGNVLLGAYGILEDLKPNSKFPGIHVVNVSNGTSYSSAIARRGQKIALEATVDGQYPTDFKGSYITQLSSGTQPASFLYIGDDPKTSLIEDPESGRIVPGQREDPSNKGFLMGPSLNHVVTAAVMRAGHAAHNDDTTIGKSMAIRLNSDRVRTALYYLEGIRSGQGLSSLLGYQFERGLHERQSNVVGLDAYIDELREKYPLVSSVTAPTPNGMNQFAQARMVTDGLTLAQRAIDNSNGNWYDGLPNIYSSGFTTDGLQIKEEVDKIVSDLESISDLLLSESVFQVTRGNHERAGSVIQGLGSGKGTQQPEIIKTPRRADTFTHRVVAQLQPTSTTSSWGGNSARANVEPALNDWLSGKLPAPQNIRVWYDYTGSNGSSTVTMSNLGFEPIDLLYIFSASGSNQALDSSELSKRIVNYVRSSHTLSDSVDVTISYTDRTNHQPGERTIFEMTPILQSLTRIIGNSRLLNPDDFVTPGALSAMVSPPGLLDSVNMQTRITNAIAAFDTASGKLKANNPLPQQQNQYTKRDSAGQIAYQANSNIPVNSGTATTILNDLRQALIDASAFGATTAYPASQSANTKDVRDLLIGQADRTYTDMINRRAQITTKMNTLIASPVSAQDHKTNVGILLEVAQLLFGRSFKVFTGFTFHIPNDVQNALAYNNLLDDAGPFAVESWMAGVARVRPRVGDYYKLTLLSEGACFVSSSQSDYTSYKVIQFPLVNLQAADDRWIGMNLPPNYAIPKDAISMVVERGSVSFSNFMYGMVIDEWPEQIPIDSVTAGIAINYDQPSSEAPNSILLAVTPEVKNYWDWDDLMETLNETIEMAKIRAVEPDMIQDKAWSQVLPMLVAQLNGDGTNTSPSLDFARNIVPVPPGYNDPIDLTTMNQS